MRDRAEVSRVDGDYDAAELRTIAATLTGNEPETVCQVVLVMVMHRPEGGHQFAAATTIPEDPAANAVILRHAADHLHGGCNHCRRANRKGGTSG